MNIPNAHNYGPKRHKTTVTSTVRTPPRQENHNEPPHQTRQASAPRGGGFLLITVIIGVVLGGVMGGLPGAVFGGIIGFLSGLIR